MVLLQETHVPPGDTREMARAHAAPWGFQSGPTARRVSFWSEMSSEASGVAILVNPFSTLTDCAPFLEAEWNAHFCAMECSLDGCRIVVVCLYIPRDTATQHAFYSKCAALEIPPEFIMAGGDFNCTLELEFDRKFAAPPSKHNSDALRSCLQSWGLEDALTNEMVQYDTAADIRDFAERHHTYTYKIGLDAQATSRIDRWYLFATAAQWQVACEPIPLADHSDHDGVLLRLTDPSICSRIKKDKRVYPPPACSADAV